MTFLWPPMTAPRGLPQLWHRNGPEWVLNWITGKLCLIMIQYIAVSFQWHDMNRGACQISGNSTAGLAACCLTAKKTSNLLRAGSFVRWIHLWPVDFSRFQKLVMFRLWCHYGIALWHQGSSALHNGLFLTTSDNINCWADIANHVAWLWQVGDMEKCLITG